jgi:hypothetical protein
MIDKWYPKKIMVGPEGTPGTYNFLESVFHKERHFAYAEFGFYLADTARNICDRFPNCSLYLFDFHENIGNAKEKLQVYANKIFYYGNSQKYNDSYNYSLIKLIKENQRQPIFDYCFLDGAHTFGIDALTFFLCDRLTRVGGYIDFDDYDWTIRDSSLDPKKVPAIADQYTDEQIDSKQVAMIVDHLVRPDSRYKEIVRNKIFQKVA